jgi:uncharacterized protein (DUF1778 family)
MAAKRAAKLGRPPKKKELLRTVLVRVLVTEDQRELLQHAAESSGLSVSSWVLNAALEKVREAG